MAIERFSLYPASFNGGGLDLDQVASVALERGASIQVVRPGGSLDPGANVLSSARPVARCFTRDLLTVLGGVSLTTGLYCSSATQLNFQQRAVGGAFTAASSSAHFTKSIAAGFLNIAELSAHAESDDGAQCSLEFVCLSSDGSNPITDASGAAINAEPTPAFNSVYYLGGAYLAAVQLEGLQRIRVRPGITYRAVIADGGAFPRAAGSSIVARDPVIELDFLNLPIATASIADEIANAFSSDLKVYFQRGTTAPGGRIAAGSGAHVKITAAAGTWGPDNVSVRDTDDATTTVVVQPTGTLALATNSTIP